mmetsp:Transcript_1351/g.5317  ORF Transcript_1351/g.5317 Transcript_1351/m.5317 type:complete len:369 (-) Transcript_1351:330-1436(-)
MGSPAAAPPTSASEWHDASTSAASATSRERSPGHVVSTGHASHAAPSAPSAPSASPGARAAVKATSLAVATPSYRSSSSVSVPVLSKQHTSHRPASTTRNGSVQNTRLLDSAMRDVLTAMDSSMGSSGGMTEVRMVTQFRKSLYLLLAGSARPWSSTRVEATAAKASKTAMKAYVSRESAVTRSPVCRMVRTSSPCAVPNPVRTTTQTHPLSGGLPTLTPPSPPPLADPCSARSTLVPANSVAVLSIVISIVSPINRSRPADTSIARLRWGVDSPVSIASVTVASPATSTRSAGTTSSSPASFTPFAHTDTTSPGTSSFANRLCHRPPRCTSSDAPLGVRDMSSSTFLSRCDATVDSNTTSIASVNSE